MSPPEPDYYALLQVQPDAGTEQIRAAYLRQVFAWHPDRNPSAEATRRTAQINAAWEVLQDPEQRRRYDRRRGRARGAAAASRARPAARERAPAPARERPDPAAAARARRAQEASARAAAERARRDAEYAQRRAAAASLWQPPPDTGLGWYDRDFVVGHWYRNNRGPYKVIDVRPNQVEIYYADGEIVIQRRDDLWRHWQQQQARHGAARAGRPAAQRR